MYALDFYHGSELKIAGVLLDRMVTVGRNPENEVMLDDASASRHHALLYAETTDGQVVAYLQDFGSTNGCEVNGRRIWNQKVVVKPGDDIRLGTHRIEIYARTPELSRFAVDCEKTILYEGPPLCQEALPLERLRLLHDYTCSVPSLSLDELFTSTWKTLASCLRHDVLCILLDIGGGEQMVRAWSVDGPADPGEVPVSKTVLDRCLRSNLALLADKKENCLPDVTEESAAWKALSSVMCVPLRNGDVNLGAVYMSSETDGVAYDQDDMKFLILVANQLSSTWIHRRTLHNLQEEAHKLEAILGSLQEGVLVADRRFIILSANASAKRMLGMTDLEERRLVDALADFQHSFDPGAFPGRSRFQIVVESRAEDRKPTDARIFSATISENTAAEDDCWKYVICLRDTTQVERNERMKSIFVNRLAHKLRTPLTVITGVNTLVAEQAEKLADPELKGLLKQSLEYSEECARLIERFVEYTTMNLDAGAILSDTTRLETLVAIATEASRDLADAKRFHIARQFPDDMFELRGSQETLSMVFLQIVQNAVKFGKQRGSLVISAERMEDRVRVSFRDDGPGIPPQEMEYLCQMLHQVDVDNTGQVPGAGLGLWLARAIVEGHGGLIELTSPVHEEEGGTLVDLTLPLSTAAIDAEEQAKNPKAFAETAELD